MPTNFRFVLSILFTDRTAGMPDCGLVRYSQPPDAVEAVVRQLIKVSPTLSLRLSGRSIANPSLVRQRTCPYLGIETDWQISTPLLLVRVTS